MKTIRQRQRARFSHQWVAQEIANAFQLPLLSVPVQMATNTFLQLARHQQGSPRRARQLPPSLWLAVREEACQFCLQTLAHLIGLEQGPDAVDPSLVQLYDDFLNRVRAYLESPAPGISEAESGMSFAERLRYEQALWQSARAALELCQKWRQALSQHEMPEDRTRDTASGDLGACREAQPQTHARKERTAPRRQHARNK